ncbi:MAG: hypothetical protein KAR42_16695 [candidate division Zixibacteria bacterium]|nr:hypothetical protein [candidate division Zixibacteria bacterium]
MTIEKGFVSQTAFKKHLDGDWRTVHELWSHIRNYMTSYPAPAATTYTKTEVDAFFEGYSGGKAQVDAGNVVGLTQGSIPFADASGFLTEDNSNLFWDGGNARLALGHTGPDTILHILTATSSEIRIETSGASDPTLKFKTTNTAHEICFHLDEGGNTDTIHLEGQTAAVDTQFVIHAKDGERARLLLYSGDANYSFVMMGSGDVMTIANTVQDRDIVLSVDDGGVTKTITWDASVDKLKHSHGLFNFDDDNILTTGTLGAGNATLGTIGCGTITIADGSSINLQEDITFTGATTVNQIKFPDNLADALSFKEAGNFYLTFVTTNGSEAIHFLKNVGIGTAAPDDLLHIYSGNSGVTPHAYSHLNIESVDHSAIQFMSPNNGGEQWIWFGDVADPTRGGVGYYQADASDHLMLRAGGSTRVYVKSDGKVVIGEAYPQLTIAGSTQSVYMQNWSDQLALLSGSYYNGAVYVQDDANFLSAKVLIARRANAAGNLLLIDSGSDADPPVWSTMLTLNHAGALAVTGCVADGTCEIMKNEDALAIIDDILKTGSGKKDEYDHERMDMEKIHAKYPFMIHEQIIKGKDEKEEIKYFDKLGAKSDLLYIAIGQLRQRIEELEAQLDN